MGQQQLLLVILVTIIVGIATVVAINTFGTAADQANIDAATNDVATLASAAQGYYMRPGMLGGGGRTFDGSGSGQSDGISFDGLAFPATGISADSSTAENENGRYILAPVDAQSFEIQAHPSSCEGYTPGTAAEGVLTPGSNCTSDADRIVATVTPNNFSIQ
jgi:type II secretory pathway pseudopilin PulG